MYLWIPATFLAFFVKGLCGFANTLVFTSVLAFGTDNVNISPIELLLNLPGNLILTWRNRAKLNRGVYLPLVILVLLGSIPGAVLLKSVNPAYLRKFFGIVVMLVGINMLLREFQLWKPRKSKLLLGGIGLLSGLLCGLFGVGALLAAYVGGVTEDSEEFKANISAVFIADNVFRLILYSSLGIITAYTIGQAMLLLPFMLLALLAGMKSAKILDEKLVKLLVIVLLILSGLMMLFQ